MGEEEPRKGALLTQGGKGVEAGVTDENGGRHRRRRDTLSSGCIGGQRRSIGWEAFGFIEGSSSVLWAMDGGDDSRNTEIPSGLRSDDWWERHGPLVWMPAWPRRLW